MSSVYQLTVCFFRPQIPCARCRNGQTVDKVSERPFDVTETQNFHYEMELVVVIGKAGLRVAQSQAHEYIFGYAGGL